MDRHVIGSRVEVGLITSPEAYLTLRSFLKPPSLLEVIAFTGVFVFLAAITLALVLMEGL